MQANDWNDRGNVEKWRKSWADICNRYLSVEQQIDHRSYKRQGLPLEPTIHERFRARQMEQRGEVSDRCEYNRIIKQLNSVTREWFQIMKALHQMIMEKARDLIRRIYDRVTGGAGYLGKAGRDSGTGGKSADGNQTPASGEQGTFHIEDKRTAGRAIDVTFQGELRKSQVPAVEKMLQHDTGILSASTAFGKTVVCSKLIAERKVSTLILLESSALIEQWVDALHNFLDIKEELPEYQTPSGRIRKRKNLIGRIHGAHDSSTGIIDIAMVGSLCKKGEPHPRLQEYGMVIMDECHHAAAATVIEILQAVKAKYVYGVTATPVRSDGLEKIGYMLLGNIRYRYTAKDRAKEQGIEHLVYPRFTRVAYPRSQEMHINDAYMLIRDSEVRNEQIVEDVKKCIAHGRTPVVLTRYKEHASLLSERLQAYADNLLLLYGNKSKKELQKVREQMEKVPAGETMILVATGQMVGEGFNYPRLDTLIMATPISWRGIVEQYAGRLNRDYAGKKDVLIYDYVDSHIDKFDRMYGKRLKAYKQIGYRICTNISAEKQEAGAIYDFENYLEVFERDLQEAEKDIIISSPRMNRKKVYRMVSLLKERQDAGVKVTVVTWHPDCYKYGKSEVRMELLEQLRSTGFEIQLMEEGCEHFMVVDQKIVWYGNMNFLSKEDMEDNLMRVVSGNIAAEIMKRTFGGEKELMNW